jgi:hypothetical protein
MLQQFHEVTNESLLSVDILEMLVPVWEVIAPSNPTIRLENFFVKLIHSGGKTIEL